jgi:gallidermin/nisin family lantibiotic
MSDFDLDATVMTDDNAANSPAITSVSLCTPGCPTGGLACASSVCTQGCHISK